MTQLPSQLPFGIELIDQDEEYFALHKPSMLHSVIHPERENNSVAEALCSLFPELSEVSARSEDAGLVNRLDFETSGILLGAKSKQSWIALRSKLLSDSVYKSYRAIVEGEAPRQRSVENYIGHPNRRSNKVRIFTREPKKSDRALLARSEISLLSYSTEHNLSVIKIIAPCARRHQIRAHAQFLGHSLLGDTLYGAQRSTKDVFSEQSPTFYLHAQEIKFEHPSLGKVITLTAPNDFPIE